MFLNEKCVSRVRRRTTVSSVSSHARTNHTHTDTRTRVPASAAYSATPRPSTLRRRRPNRGVTVDKVCIFGHFYDTFFPLVLRPSVAKARDAITTYSVFNPVPVTNVVPQPSTVAGVLDLGDRAQKKKKNVESKLPRRN